MQFSVFLAQALLFPLVLGQHADFNALDPNDDMNEEEFEKYYNKLPPQDPEEYKRREEALKKNEEEVKEVNKKFMKGESTWFEGVNEFSDLPEDEFKQEKTGYNAPDLNITEGRGLLKPTPDMVVHPDSELYFASVRLNRGNAPRSYSSVDQGYVTSVKSQETCGSCVAFSTAAALEVCFAKVLGKKTDVSEQNFLDCGYQQNRAGGCNGAQLYSYGKTWVDKKLSLAHEAQYPYKNTVNQCNNVPKYKFGAEIVENYHTYSGDEDLMKELVYKHGAVVTSLAAAGPFQQYKGGIFAGCTSKQRDHAVTVVGYGEEKGIPYWLIKNSWGENIGEKGYWRVRRGVNMCGIGIDISIPICGKVSGPTDAPMKVEKPCKDNSDQCPQYAKYCSQGNVKKVCPKTCGTCGSNTGGNTGGNTESTCKDKYSNCGNYKSWCTKNAEVQAGCPVTCGTCNGNTKPVSNCKDQANECPYYKDYCSYQQISQYCEKTCGLC